jgi:RNA polymerase sigma factor (sigma-70 family)
MGNSNELNDHRLVRECLAGSEKAWKEFYARFVGLIRSVISKRSWLQPEDVEDIVQMTFMSLTTALSHYDFQRSLPRYLCVIAERVAIDEYRKTVAAKREAELEGTDSLDQMPTTWSGSSNRASHDEQLETAQLLHRLRTALATLDPKCRHLVELRYFDEMSFSEIGRQNAVTENTATVQTRRCLEKLKAKLKDLHDR